MGILADLLLGPAEDDGDYTDDYAATGTVDEHPFDLNCGCGFCADEWRVSVHEAGHVLAFESRGWDWEYVTVRNKDPHVQSVVDTDDLSRRGDLYDYMVIMHAGHAAERAVFGTFTVSSHDVEGLDDLSGRHPDPDASERAEAAAEALVAEHLDDIVELAEQLFCEGTVCP